MTTIANVESNIKAQLQSMERSVILSFFGDSPADVSLTDALSNLRALLSQGVLKPHASFANLDADALVAQMRNLLYTRMAIHLPTILADAMSNLDDVEAGLADGTFNADENSDLHERRAIANQFWLCISPGEQTALQLLQTLPDNLPPIPKGVNIALLQALISDEGEYFALEALSESSPAGVISLDGGRYFTYHVGGEDPLFTDELRAKVEAAIGQSLVVVGLESANPAHRGRVVAADLVFPEDIRDGMATLIKALKPEGLDEWR